METGLIPLTPKALSLNTSAKAPAIIRGQAEAGGYVPHLGLAEVRRLAEGAGQVGRHRERDRLLVIILFDGCLRASEALGLRPRDLKQDSSGWRIEIFGKGRKPGVAAISPSLAAQLHSYAYRHNLKPEDRFFPINRSRAFQVVERATKLAGIAKPDHVGAVHVLRHSGAIERLRATGNPRAVQEQLRHTTARMTLRYFKTLQVEEAIQIQEGIDFTW